MKAEANGKKEAAEQEKANAQVAAFFDLDGTLTPLPSLERRFLRILRNRREIPLRNYLFWLREAVRLLPQGISAMAHANKMYLQGVQTFIESSSEDCADSSTHKNGHQGEGQASTPPKRNPRRPVPRFFEEGIERALCHAMLGHAIVMVSGTLEPLAAEAARVLATELAARGFAAQVRVCATRLEEIGERWTGQILGEAMFGRAKARAVKKLAEDLRLDLAQCWAYGDRWNDRWLLASVGHPTAANPSRKLARTASRQSWPVLRWDERNLTQQIQRTPSTWSGATEKTKAQTEAIRTMKRSEKSDAFGMNSVGNMDSPSGSPG